MEEGKEGGGEEGDRIQVQPQLLVQIEEQLPIHTLSLVPNPHGHTHIHIYLQEEHRQYID